MTPKKRLGEELRRRMLEFIDSEEFNRLTPAQACNRWDEMAAEIHEELEPSLDALGVPADHPARRRLALAKRESKRESKPESKPKGKPLPTRGVPAAKPQDASTAELPDDPDEGVSFEVHSRHKPTLH